MAEAQQPEGQHRDPFVIFRRGVTFLLGVAIIIDALSRSAHAIAELVIGAVLIGVIPVDEYLQQRGRGRCRRCGSKE